MTEATEKMLTDEQELLEDSFPAGMFGGDESGGSQNALRMVRIVERMIEESSARNALLGRYALLQTFPRLAETEKSQSLYGDYCPEPVADVLRQYCRALCPNSLAEVFQSLDDIEVEVFLKNYLHAHERWGHPEGVATLVRTMLETCTHDGMRVDVRGLEGQECPVPADLISHLGKEKEFSSLGKNFLLGNRVVARPSSYEILVGPIGASTLGALQQGGWAEDIAPSMKLCQLVELAEPFYLRGRVRFVFEKSGFLLRSATLGKNRLGIVAGEGLN